MTRYLIAIALVFTAACSSNVEIQADDDCMSVWSLFSERQDDFRASCTRQRVYDFDDVGCMNGTNPTPEQIAQCRPLIAAATDCTELDDAIRTCEGRTTDGIACLDVADAYDFARGRLRCPYHWDACPSMAMDEACIADFGAAASCDELDAAATRCSM